MRHDISRGDPLPPEHGSTESSISGGVHGLRLDPAGRNPEVFHKALGH